MIICIDPDPTDRARTREALSDAGFSVAVGGSMADCRTLLEDGSTVDCLITEYELPDATGLELVSAVRDRTPDTTCILFTDVPVDAIDTDGYDDVILEYLPKDGQALADELVPLVDHSIALRSQTAYPLPDDEDDRVAALERYTTDSAALGDALDRLTALATAQFDVNSAAVGLIDPHSERFLACHGASFGTTDREDTICTFTILDDGVTVIEDVAEDPRFRDDPGLAEAAVRFYAGAPMRTPDGHAIGVFCLHDDTPRRFPASDQDRLAMFAAEAMEQLELRRRIDTATGASVDER